jgi:hypothetical protein
MRYLLLIYLEPPPTPPSQAEWEAMSAAYDAYTDRLRESGRFLGGEALQDVSTATAVSVRDGRRIVTDGPFAETKEHLAGYYLIEAPDLDAAIEAAALIPGAMLGTIEVRPIRERA